MIETKGDTAYLKCDLCREYAGMTATGSKKVSEVREMARNRGKWIRRRVISGLIDLCHVCGKHVKSERQLLAQDFADLLRENGLAGCATDAQVIKELDDDKTYYSILFSCYDLSGQIDIYSEKFIRVQFHCDAYQGSPIYESPDDAREFIRQAFIEEEWIEAHKIPTKPDRVAQI